MDDKKQTENDDGVLEKYPTDDKGGALYRSRRIIANADSVGVNIRIKPDEKGRIKF